MRTTPSWFRLDIAVVLLLVVCVGVISGALLLVAHRTSLDAISRDTRTRSEFHHLLVQRTLEDRLRTIEAQAAAGASRLATALDEADKQTLFLVMNSLNSQMSFQNQPFMADILLLLNSRGELVLNAGLPFFDAQGAMRRYLDSPTRFARWNLSIPSPEAGAATDILAAMRAIPVIESDSGRQNGTLLLGVVLENNLALLRELRSGAQVAGVQLRFGGEILGEIGFSSLPGGPGQEALLSQGGHYLSEGFELPIGDQVLDAQVLLSGQAMGQLRRAQAEMWWQFGILLVLLSFTALLLVHLFARKALAPLMGYAEAVTQGRDGQGFQGSMVHEFTLLGQALENMVASLRRGEQELKQTNQSLQEASRQLERYFNSSLDLLCIGNDKGEFVRVNPEWENVLGYSAAELEGRHFLDFVHPEDMEGSRAAIAKLVQLEEPQIFLNRYRRKDGTYCWIEWHCMRVADQIHVVARDITERRHSEEALRESQARLQAITDSAQDAIIMMGPEGEISYWNPMAESIFGYCAEEVMGKSLHSLLAPQRYWNAFQEFFPEFSRTGHGSAVGKTTELAALTKDGMEIPIALSLSAVSLGGAWHAVGIARDVSLQKMADQKLIQAKEQAEAANMAKSEFLSNMSHELRTPFNGIMGMMQLLQTTPLNEEQQTFVTTAITSSERFTRLLSDILDLSSIEAGKMVICPSEFALKDVLESVSGLFTVAARQKGIALECSLDNAVPSHVVGDAVRVRQVLFNLVGNALKFAEQGVVKVHLGTLSAAKGADARILFSVADTGIGIPDDKLKNLFQPFAQVDGSYTRPYQGAGLGLVIVRRLVALMGGNIGVESVVGQGTTVHVALPFTLPAPTVSPPAPSSPAPIEAGKHLNILLAEDDPVNQLFMRSILQKLGHTVTLAQNGQEAVDFWKTNTFDCILMDIQMPVMTGDEATRRIREAEVHGSRFNGSAVGEEEVHGSRFSGSAVGGAGVGAHRGTPDRVTPNAPYSGATPPPTVNREPLNREPHIPIIAITAHTQPGDREKFLAMGMDGYLGKPVRMEDLQKVLENFSG